MSLNHLPPEIGYHTPRLSELSRVWLKEEFYQFVSKEESKNKNLDSFTRINLTDFYFNLLRNDEPVDAEIVYLIVKLGVLSGQLTRVLSLRWPNKAPSVLAYQGLALIFMNKFLEAEEYLNEAEEKASIESDSAVLLETWGFKIYLENARYSYHRGLKIYDKALAYYKAIKNEQTREELSPFFQWVRIAGAKSLLKTGNVKECLYLNQNALNEANKNKDKFFRSFSLLGLGHALDLVGQIKESVRLYLKALKLAQKIHAYNLVSIIYNRLGMASAWRLNNLDEGAEYFQRAVLFSNKGEGFWLKDGPMWNLAATYQSKKDFAKAIHTIQEIAFNARQAGESRTELIATLNLAQLFEEIGNLDEAKKTRDVGESLANILGISLKDSEQEDYDTFEEGDLDTESLDDDEEYYEQDTEDDSIDEDLDLIDDEYYSSTLEFKIDLGPDDEEDD